MRDPGAYILANSTLPGFSRQEQARLAAIVLGHRRKLSLATFDELPAEWRETVLRLCLLLRIAVRLNRARSSAFETEFQLRPIEEGKASKDGKDGLEIAFPEDWLDGHPLTRADLEEEGQLLRGAGLTLKIRAT